MLHQSLSYLISIPRLAIQPYMNSGTSQAGNLINPKGLSAENIEYLDDELMTSDK